MGHKLTPKQERFCLEYMKDLNATQAAVRTGYSEKAAEVQGHRMLRNVKVATRIQALMNKRSQKLEITADLVLQEILKLAQFDIADIYDESGKLLPVKDIPERARKALVGIDIYTDFTEGVEVGETKKVKMADKLRALELLGKHLKLFTDRVEHTGKVTLESLIAGDDDPSSEKD